MSMGSLSRVLSINVYARLAVGKSSAEFVGRRLQRHRDQSKPPFLIKHFAAQQANQLKLKWAAGGGGLLAEASSDSDKSNQSYYGDTKLHFLSVRRHHGCKQS